MKVTSSNAIDVWRIRINNLLKNFAPYRQLTSPAHGALRRLGMVRRCRYSSRLHRLAGCLQPLVNFPQTIISLHDFTNTRTRKRLFQHCVVLLFTLGIRVLLNILLRHFALLHISRPFLESTAARDRIVVPYQHVFAVRLVSSLEATRRSQHMVCNRVWMIGNTFRLALKHHSNTLPLLLRQSRAMRCAITISIVLCLRDGRSLLVAVFRLSVRNVV